MTASASPPCRLAAFAVALGFAVAGLALGALFASTEAFAQDRLVNLAERHNLADNSGTLFAHTASGGSALEKGGSRGEWVIKFKGVPNKALLFEDRPGRREEPIAMGRMLAGFFAKPGVVPPNAALSLETRGGEQTLVGVELLDGRYNRDRGVARYRVRSLKQHGDQPLRLPRRFGDSSVFIDDEEFHSCTTIVSGGMSYGGGRLTLLGANKAENDSWTITGQLGSTAPPPYLLGAPGEQTGWGSTSGATRGCWNNAGYGDQYGSVEFSVEDPWSGPNTYSCTTTGNYVCNGPMFVYPDLNPDGYGSYLGGNSVRVLWEVCPVNLPTNCGDRPAN